MGKRISYFEHNGKNVLGFDTGLSARSFAMTKTATFLSCPGFIVYPDGGVELWQQGGVVERGKMTIWGPFFPGERMDEIVNDSSRRDEALNALRYWLRAWQALEDFPDDSKQPPFPGPAGAFIVSRPHAEFPIGTVFFPPANLIKHCLEAEEQLAAESWIHPDLQGAEAASFSAATMLYRIFCAAGAFQKDNLDELRRDIREGVYTPPNKTAPGLEAEISELITGVLGGAGLSRSRGNKMQTAIGAFSEVLGPPSSRPVSSWFKPLNEEELLRFQAEREQYNRKKTRAVKRRRFVARNTALITASVIAFFAILFTVLGIMRHNAERPSTRGMSPLQVVNAWYAAFDTLDITMMRACVTGRAGRGEMEMAANLFAMSSVRQAFEPERGGILPAQEWLAYGRPPVTGRIVFGITDLTIRPISADETRATFEAEYTLWLPGTFFLSGEPATAAEIPPPGALAFEDRLYLSFHRGAWRITEIIRSSELLE